MPPTFESEFPGLAHALRGQLTVERELGRGGMGVVYLARDVMLDRAVAMKVLPPHLAAQEEMRERFLREARTAARLAHPNVVPVHRADEIDGAAFFTMAFIEGETLAERIRDRGPLTPAEGIRIFREVAWALAYAHARGVVHRDVKPENILLDRATGRALVSDFGIARQADSARITQQGLVLGTFHYMSPEQVSGLELDGRSDVYSLGVVMYQALSGRLPFDGLTAPAVLMAHATRQPPPLRSVAADVPPALGSIVARCLEKRPEDRFPNCESLEMALEDALETSAPAIASLPEGMPDVLSEAQAAAIWQRAAQLQADALHRLERRRDLMPRETHAATTASDVASGGYKFTDVAAAAEEAGISRQYVAMALAEIPRGEQALAAPAALDERVATRYLGTSERSLAVSVTVQAAPARTLRALGSALRESPYSLVLREVVGPHPLDGGVMIFDLPSHSASAHDATTGQWVLNSYWMGLHLQLEARQVQITLRPLPGDPTRTEVTMTADLRPGVRRNVKYSKGFAGVLGGLATTGGGLLAWFTIASAALAATGGIAVGAAVAAGSVALYRSSYRSTLTKARNEMLRALEYISGAMRAEEVFGGTPSLTGPALTDKATSA
jgi:predicted Ser/Thr protein kinase